MSVIIAVTKYQTSKWLLTYECHQYNLILILAEYSFGIQVNVPQTDKPVDMQISGTRQ
jgi:hypothetical protein